MLRQRFAFIASVFTLLSIPFSVSAISDIEWLEEAFDFGTFLEAAGPKTGSVRFINHGPDATMITRVRPSCGCTGEMHTEGIILPGDTATVYFTYNPVGRPGRFEKTVKVYVGENNDLKTIPISGTVIGTPETLQADYPFEAGALRLSDSKLLGGDIRYGTTRHCFLKGYNQSNDTIRPVWKVGSDALSIDISTPEVLPGDVVSFSIYFNSRDLTAPGPVKIPVLFKPTKDSADEYSVTYIANVYPDTHSISKEEADNGPRLYIKQELVDVGVIKGTKVLEREVEFVNDGKSELRISRIYSNTDGVKAPRYPQRLAPGKKGKLTLRIDPKILPPGPQAVMVDVYSNDPLHPVRTLRIAIDNE